jgi:cytochrome c oxidase assembly factor CtaG
LHPLVVATLVVAGVVYALGWRRLARSRSARVWKWRAVAFGAALFSLWMALISPLDAMAHQLFAMHMLQHLVLILVAAPLIAASAPLLVSGLVLPRALSRTGRRVARSRAGSALSHPLVILGAHVVAIWAWHLPALYEAALRSTFVHVLEHASFLGTGIAYWWVLFRRRPRLFGGQAVLYLFAGGIQGAALGALITFAPTLLYDVHTETIVWGLTPLEDQQVAGATMWVPSGIVYVLAAAVVFVRWLRSVQRDGDDAIPAGEVRA